MGDDPNTHIDLENTVANDVTAIQTAVAVGHDAEARGTGAEHEAEGLQQEAPGVESSTVPAIEDSKKLTHDVTTEIHDAEPAAAAEHDAAETHIAAHDLADDLAVESSALSTPVESIAAPGETHTGILGAVAGLSHPGPAKRFVSSANINKKFLQKTSTAPSPAPIAGKGATPTAMRPTSVTPTHSQSRLITTKLTMVAPAVVAASAGWNKGATSSGNVSPQPVTTPSIAHATPLGPLSAKPSSVNAVPPTGPLSTSMKSASTLSIPSASGVAPAGIPSPTTSIATSSTGRAPGMVLNKSAPAGKAWGQLPPAGALSVIKPSPQVDVEFPTAAEAAKGKRLKAVAQMQMKSEIQHVPLADTSADAFRGVHLDPNAHHWDEMEDEDNDFLAGEVEFGDGRQYKVAVTETVADEVAPVPAIPVSKEERFSDDFDRSWPRSAALQQPPHERPPEVARHPPQISPTGEQRALFNERLNRLEPWARGAQPAQGPARRRNSIDEHGPMSGGRDPPPHTGMHVLQKDSRASHIPPRERYPLPERGPSRMSEDSASPRSELVPPGRGLPARGSESIRQLPPHLAHMHTIPPREGPPARDALSPPSAPPPALSRPHISSSSTADLPAFPPPLVIPPLTGSISTAPDSLSLKSASPEVSVPAGLPPAAVDVGELHKLAMHSAAERAKRRRQEEEEERERERDRARKKAQELEERIKAVEMQKQPKLEQQREIPRAEEQQRREAERRPHVEGAAYPRTANGVLESAMSSSEARPLHSIPSRPPHSVRAPGIAAQVAELIEPASTRSTSWRSSKPTHAPPAPDSHANSHAAAAVSPVQRLKSPSDWTKSPSDWALPPSSSAAALPSRPARPPVEVPTTAPPKMVSPIVSTVAEVLAFDTGGEVEEMDYADMSRLTGGKDEARKGTDRRYQEQVTSPRTSQMPPNEELTDRQPQAPPRPRAERAPSMLSKSDVGPWRRPGLPPAPPEQPTEFVHAAGESHSSTRAESSSTLPTDPHSFHTEDVAAEPPVPRVSVPGSAPPPPKHQHTLSHQKLPYREPALSALDDTMSRIMGALGAMQEARDHAVNGEKSGEAVESRPAAPRKPVSLDPWLLEVLSHIDRPVSPPLVWRSYPVRVPKQSRSREIIAPLRLQAFLQPPPPASMDILCWVPPVKDMSIRTLSRDDLFFRKTYNRGVVNARVLLPQHPFTPYERPPAVAVVRLPVSDKLRSDLSAPADASLVASAIPRVLLPKSKATVLLPRDIPDSVRQQYAGRFSKQIGVNGIHETVDEAISLNGLKLTSRSPPPDLSYLLPTRLEELSSTKAPLSSTPSRGRAPPRMPEGVNLVLYNSPNSYNLGGDASTVRFTVSSELDADDVSFASPGDHHVGVDMAVKIDQEMADNDVPGETLPQGVDAAGSTKSSEDSASSLLSNMQPATTAPTSVPSPEMDSLKSTSSATPTKTSVTPATGMTPNIWGKALLPDPEHLKAVWSQPSGTSTTTENSLKGISDEFPTVLPVSVQELRSEDGDLPGLKTADGLPSSGLMSASSADAPARPSLFDPHKSFQQVPTQPSSGRPFGSPATYGSTNLQSYGNTNYAPNSSSRPPMNSNSGHHMRPFQGVYPPIGPAHSPSPPIMFPSPNPYMMMPSMPGSHGLTNAVSPQVPQRMWMQQPSTQGSYMPAGSTYPSMVAYNNPGTIGQMGRPYQPMPVSSKAPGAGTGERAMQVPGLHNAGLAHTNPIGAHVTPAYAGIGNMEQLPGYSQPVVGALAQSHVPYSPHLPNNSQQVYGVPIGAGRGNVRNAYDNGGYQQVPPGSFVRPSGW